MADTVIRIELYNALTDTKIGDIYEGFVFDERVYGLSGGNINLRAITDPDLVGSVRLIITSSTGFSYTRTENTAPYAQFGDDSGNYIPWASSSVYSTGTYNIKATPYSLSGATGTVGTALTYNISFVSSSNVTQFPNLELTNATIVNYTQ